MIVKHSSRMIRTLLSKVVNNSYSRIFVWRGLNFSELRRLLLEISITFLIQWWCANWPWRLSFFFIPTFIVQVQHRLTGLVDSRFISMYVIMKIWSEEALKFSFPEAKITSSVTMKMFKLFKKCLYFNHVLCYNQQETRTDSRSIMYNWNM